MDEDDCRRPRARLLKNVPPGTELHRPPGAARRLAQISVKVQWVGTVFARDISGWAIQWVNIETRKPDAASPASVIQKMKSVSIAAHLGLLPTTISCEL